MTSVLGRTGETVATIWHEREDGSIAAGDWAGLVVTPDDLDRRGGDRVRRRVATLGRPFDFLLARGIVAGDLKVGWPLHRLQCFRDEKLLRHVVIEAADVLDAEWIAANTPVQGVVIEYAPSEMAARYRLFDAAAHARVALVGHAETAEAAALQLSTPQFAATLIAPALAVPTAMTADAAEAAWIEYSAAHAAPPKLRGAHPPEAE